MTSLLFDREHAFLGEVATNGGRMERLTLTAAGEKRLGAHFKDWQVRGVPHLCEVLKPSDGKAHPVFYQERVKTNDNEFLHAFRRWIENHGMALVSLSHDTVECWEMIARLPLEPRERFSLIVTLRSAEPENLAACRTALQAAVKAVDEEHEKLREAIAKLWEGAAKELIKKFGKAKVKA